jgi:LDH2 family malate/lactate/ureidoglycolate dehydrogenase
MGLSVLASLLTTGLAGGRPVHRRVRPGTAEDSQHYFQAIDPGAFCDAGRFARDLAAYLDELRGQSSAPGSAPLSLPGDNGSTRAESIREEGIPVPADLYAELRRWDPDGGDAAPRR